MNRFSFSPEFGWFVCGLMVASGVDAIRDDDWTGALIFAAFGGALLVVLIARWRRDHA